MKRIKRMPADEARFCRREIINSELHKWYSFPKWMEYWEGSKLQAIKKVVREYESNHYGKELDVYRHKTF